MPDEPKTVTPPAVHKEGPEIVMADEPFEGSKNPGGSDPGDQGLSFTPDDKVHIAGENDDEF